MEGLTTIQKLAVLFLPVLFAITVHEAAHGWMAKRLGDQTAALLGRVTLNPLRHIDLMGTIVVPMAMFALTGFLFGWAKPVPVDFRNLRQPRRDMALVAIAGPSANLIMAILWAGLIHLGIILGDDYAWFALPMIYMGSAGILINAFLMVLNLIPILPFSKKNFPSVRHRRLILLLKTTDMKLFTYLKQLLLTLTNSPVK